MMKNNIWMTLVVVLSLFAVSPALAVGKVTVDPNSLPKVEAPAAVVVGAGDKRLDQKVTFDAPNARLHDVVQTIAEKTKVTIYCGSTADDWRVRDIPVTVAARDITVRKLLEYLVYSTRTRLEERKTDKDSVYIVKVDAKREKVLDDYAKSCSDYEMTKLKWHLGVAEKLKDIPVSEMKAPVNADTGWQSRVGINRAASKLLATLDSDTKARLLAGEVLLYSPHTALPALRESLLGFLKAVDTQIVNGMRALYTAQVSNPADVPEVEIASSGELEDGCVRLMLEDSDIIIDGVFQLQQNNRTACRDQGCSVKGITELASANMSEPKSPPYPQALVPEMPAKEFEYSWLAADLQKKLAIKFPDDKEVSFSEALVALSKETGYSIICEDDPSTQIQRKICRETFATDCSIVEKVQRVPALWMTNSTEKVLLGLQRQKRRLIPERVVKDLTAKANGDGVSFDDLAALSTYSAEEVAAWLIADTLSKLPYDDFTQPKNKRVFMLYNSLSASKKQIVKSKTGIIIADVDLNKIMNSLKAAARTVKLAIFQPGEVSSLDKLSDKSAVPNLSMRLQTDMNDKFGALEGVDLNSGEVKIPLGFVERSLCKFYIEGAIGTQPYFAQVGRGWELPYFAPDREKQLTMVVQKLTTKGK